jgi:hypothetical protein
VSCAVFIARLCKTSIYSDRSSDGMRPHRPYFLSATVGGTVMSSKLKKRNFHEPDQLALIPPLHFHKLSLRMLSSFPIQVVCFALPLNYIIPRHTPSDFESQCPRMRNSKKRLRVRVSVKHYRLKVNEEIWIWYQPCARTHSTVHPYASQIILCRCRNCGLLVSIT